MRSESACGRGSGRSPSVLVLIPARNEASDIGPIVEQVAARLPVLVVDDGSADETARLSRAAGAEVVRHPRNLGKGAALKTGFAWAMQRGFDGVITLDGDGQHDPSEVERLLRAAGDCADGMVIGERLFSAMPWPRWWTQPLGSRLLSIALGVRIRDNQSGFRLITRSLLERIQLSAAGYEMEVEMIGEAVRLGAPIVWVPIRTIYHRNKRRGFRPIVDTLRFLRMVWLLWRRRRWWERPSSPSTRE